MRLLQITNFALDIAKYSAIHTTSTIESNVVDVANTNSTIWGIVLIVSIVAVIGFTIWLEKDN